MENEPELLNEASDNVPSPVGPPPRVPATSDLDLVMYEEMGTLISNTGQVINNCLSIGDDDDCIILDGGYAEYKLREHTGELFEFLGSGEETRKIPGSWRLR